MTFEKLVEDVRSRTKGFVGWVKGLYEEHEKVFKRVVFVLSSMWIGGVGTQIIEGIVSIPKRLQGMPTGGIWLGPVWSIIKSINPLGLILTGVSMPIMLYIYHYQIKPRIKQKKGVDDMERNFTYSDLGTYGTSHWITEQNLKMVAEVKPVGETMGDILGEYGDGNVVSIPTKYEFDIKHKDTLIADRINYMLNGHVAVCGAPGTMKSRAVARNWILQSVLRGDSMIITDPKGELAQCSYDYLVSQGYTVKLFNLVDMYHSDSWNCLAEIKGNEINAEIFARAIVDNVAEGETGYWKNNAQNLLKAVCMYVEMTPGIPTNMGEVYDLIATCKQDELDACFARLSKKSPAKRAYDIYSTCESKVKDQIRNNLGIFLSVFQSEIAREITGNTDIDLELPAGEKCAYFCITSDQHKTFDFIAVLFYTMLFIRLVGVARREPSQRAKKTIKFILDEFPNIGQIPDFCKKISVVRSAGLDLMVMFQNIAQMQNRYPNGQWEEILGCCDTFLCLGNTDETTQKYISNRTGIATINVKTESHEYDNQKPYLNQDTDQKENSSVGKRNLLTPDEVGALKNTELLVFLRGQRPLKLKKFDFTKHPNGKDLVVRNFDEYTPKWRELLYLSGDVEKIAIIEGTREGNNDTEESKARLKLQMEQVEQRAKGIKEVTYDDTEESEAYVFTDNLFEDN